MGFWEKLKKIYMGDVFGAAISEADEAFFDDLEEMLILADVGLTTATEAVQELRTRMIEDKISGQEPVKACLREILAERLNVGDTRLNLSTKPSVVLVVGVNGVGKTTSIGKLANSLRLEGKRVLLCAGDTFRAAAADQLEIWSNRARCEIVRQKEGADPGGHLPGRRRRSAGDLVPAGPGGAGPPEGGRGPRRGALRRPPGRQGPGRGRGDLRHRRAAPQQGQPDGGAGQAAQDH